MYHRRHKVSVILLAFVMFFVQAVPALAISFGSAASLSTNTHTTGYRAYSMGDIDNNGTPDLVGEGTSTYLSVLRDINGTPAYSSQSHLSAISFNFYANALGDLDGDGDLDLVTAGPNGSTTSPNNVYYWNSTLNRYEYVNSAYGISGNTIAFYGVNAAIADFTGDGKNDILWLSSQSAYIAINTTTTTDTLTFSGVTNLGYAINNNSFGNYSIGLGDFNNDGNKDFASTADSFTNPNFGGYFHLGLGTGSGTFTFSTPVAFAGDNYRALSIAVGDLNGDSKDDIVLTRSLVSGPTGNIIVYLRNASNTGFDATTFDTGSNIYRGVRVIDIDSDGDRDILLQTSSSGPIDTYLNPGTGVFSATPDNSLSISSRDQFFVQDVSGDSLKDIIVLSGSSVAKHVQTAADTTAPTITNVSSDKTNGTYGVGEVIDIDVTFSEAVTSTGNVTVTLETGATDRTCTFTVSAATTGTCNYTVQSGDVSSDLTVNTISGTIKDAALNSMTNFAPTTNLAANKALVIETTAPTITNVSSDKANGTYTVGEVIDIDVTFSEAVTSTGNVTVTLETGATDRTCTFTITSSTTGTCNYTVQTGDTSTDLDVNTVTGTIKDAALNSLTNFVPATNLAANKALVIGAVTTGGGTMCPQPSVRVSTPNGGEKLWWGKEEFMFFVTEGCQISGVKLELSTDGGKTFPLSIVESAPHTGGYYKWIIPSVTTSSARVRATLLGGGSPSDVSDADFEIADPNAKATITIMQQPSHPSGFLKPRDMFVAAWTATGEGIAKVRISLSVDGGKRFRPVATVDAAAASFEWKVPVFASKKAVLKFEALDANGAVIGTSVSSIFSFKTRTRTERIVIPSLSI